MDEQISFYENKLKFEIDIWDLFEKLNNEEDIIVIDARSKEAFEIERIPGSINVSHRLMSEDTTKHFDKEMLYVTYCDGIGCNASTKGALNMTKLGFCVKELLGGLDWWKRDGYQTEGTNSSKGKEIVCAC